ncbi:MAG TPA: hypothetical protein VNZ54_10180, partial [bacterium]|nr:hypothetical protein [bacterium]
MSATKGTAAPAQPVQVSSSQPRGSKPGVKVDRFYTKPGVNVWDTTAWEKRSAVITNENGKVV